MLRRDEQARVMVELPLREAYGAEVAEFKARMRGSRFEGGGGGAGDGMG